MIVTIDGPTGSGKTTTARLLASKLGYFHIKGGIFLRSLTYYCLNNNFSNRNEIISAAETIDLEVFKDDVPLSLGKLLLNGVELKDEQLWSKDVDKLVPVVAGINNVREIRKCWLRKLSEGLDIVADGRTLGTEIFPEAENKFVLTCKIGKRAERRFAQRNYTGNLEAVRKQIEDRDQQDSQGDHDRTVFSTNAIVMDSTEKSVTEVVEGMLKFIRKK